LEASLVKVLDIFILDTMPVSQLPYESKLRLNYTSIFALSMLIIKLSIVHYSEGIVTLYKVSNLVLTDVL
jgi:hypothetical protein